MSLFHASMSKFEWDMIQLPIFRHYPWTGATLLKIFTNGIIYMFVSNLYLDLDRLLGDHGMDAE